VMRMPDVTAASVDWENAPRDKIQQLCPRCQQRFRAGKPLNCPKCEAEVQAKESLSSEGPVVDSAVQQQMASLRGKGRSLPVSVRSFFEPRFGTNFSDVRVHTNSPADAAARSVRAEAFTVGRDMVFRSGAYRPGTESGRKLLAHELTHVVQQKPTGGGQRRNIRPSGTVSAQAGAAERDTEPVAASIVPGGQRYHHAATRGDAGSEAGGARAPVIARKEREEGGNDSGSGGQRPDVRMFIGPTISWGGSQTCPTRSEVLRGVIDQVWSRTQTELVPPLKGLRQVSGQSSLASQGAGLIDKIVGEMTQIGLWAVDAILSLGGSAASTVAQAISNDIQRIDDLLANARAHLETDSPAAARVLIDQAYGLLVRNMYWLQFRDRRPGPEEFNLFGHCSDRE